MKKLINIIIILFSVLCCLLLAHNFSADSFAFAYAAKYGKDLLNPHHLLFNVLNRLIIILTDCFLVDTLKILQIANIGFAVGCLCVFKRLLYKITDNIKVVAVAIVFVASSFAFLRFATQLECYIIQAFFSLLAINSFCNYLKNNKTKSLVFSTIYLICGTVFHQLTILIWFSTLLILIVRCNKVNFKHLLIFLLLSVFIPLIYFISYYILTGSVNPNNVIAFSMHDYLNGTAEMPQLKRVIFFTAASLIRTFIQIHGLILPFAEKYMICSIIVVISSLSFIILSIIYVFKTKKNKKLCIISKIKGEYTLTLKYIYTNLIICFMFAAFSNGNAEFMLLLPFFIAIVFVLQCSAYKKSLLYLSFAMLVWNISFGLIPYRFEKLDVNNEEVEIVKAYPNAVFVLRNRTEIENMYMYYYGDEPKAKLINEYGFCKDTLEILMNGHPKIIIDFAYGIEPKSRRSITNGNKDWINSYIDKPFISFEALGIKKMLFEIKNTKYKYE
ncbi:MAG: hypothetical protein LBR28_03920 [Bacteroidales bacterium]|jgi:hypothetical protein|nr:hypothetical protein [Bacteroidales bacterium]